MYTLKCPTDIKYYIIKYFVFFLNKSKFGGEIFYNHHMEFLWVMTINRDGVLLAATGASKESHWDVGGDTWLLAFQKDLRCSRET